MSGADLISAVAAESNEELASGLAEDFSQMSGAQARFLVRLGEFERRQAFRDDGATSLESWTAERFGISTPSGSGLRPCRREGLGPPPPRGCALQRGPLLRQGAGAGRRGHPRDRAGAVRPGQGMLGPRAGRHRPLRSRAGPDRSLLSAALCARWSLLALQRHLPHHQRPVAAPIPTPRPRPGSTPVLKQVPSDGRDTLDQRRCDAFVGIVHASNGSRASDRPPRPAPMSWWPTSPWPPWSRTQARRAPSPASSSTGA